MLYLWGPGLDAEVEYRRIELGRPVSGVKHWWRQTRRAVSALGRNRPRPW